MTKTVTKTKKGLMSIPKKPFNALIFIDGTEEGT